MEAMGWISTIAIGMFIGFVFGVLASLALVKHILRESTASICQAMTASLNAMCTSICERNLEVLRDCLKQAGYKIH